MTHQQRYEALITFTSTDHPDMTPEQISEHIASETEELENDEYQAAWKEEWTDANLYELFFLTD